MTTAGDIGSGTNKGSMVRYGSKKLIKRKNKENKMKTFKDFCNKIDELKEDNNSLSPKEQESILKSFKKFEKISEGELKDILINKEIASFLPNSEKEWEENHFKAEFDKTNLKSGDKGLYIEIVYSYYDGKRKMYEQGTITIFPNDLKKY